MKRAIYDYNEPLEVRDKRLREKFTDPNYKGPGEVDPLWRWREWNNFAYPEHF